MTQNPRFESPSTKPGQFVRNLVRIGLRSDGFMMGKCRNAICARTQRVRFDSHPGPVARAGLASAGPAVPVAPCPAPDIRLRGVVAVISRSGEIVIVVDRTRRVIAVSVGIWPWKCASDNGSCHKSAGDGGSPPAVSGCGRVGIAIVAAAITAAPASAVTAFLMALPQLGDPSSGHPCLHCAMAPLNKD